MGETGADLTSNIKTALELGRVSNLPTVWTNTLAGAVLAAGILQPGFIVLLMLAMSLAYIGGMYLNDAFDRKIDAQERPERPIPSGRIKASEVFATGFTLLIASVLLTTWAAYGWGFNTLLVAVMSVTLCVTIVLYDSWHKNNPISPLIMGVCRVLVILIAGFASTDTPSPMLFYGAAAVLCYLIGLTYVAKQENLNAVKNLWPLVFLIAPIGFGVFHAFGNWHGAIVTALLAAMVIAAVFFVRRRQDGDIPKAVVTMIAGISLVDAVLIISVSSLIIAAWAIAGFLLTLALQRFISGT